MQKLLNFNSFCISVHKLDFFMSLCYALFTRRNDIKRFDIKGKEFLRTLGKYYIVDIGLRNYLLGFRDRDSGHAIENVVYFELLRRGYDQRRCSQARISTTLENQR